MTTHTGVKRLFWDVEITPNVVLSFRTGYDLVINHDAIVKERSLICIAYKWGHEKKVTVLRCDESGDDRSLIERFIEVALEADELVAHFGDKADLPWLRARALIHHLNPLPLFKTIDTKSWASKHYGFNCNKLDHLSQVLGHGGKLKTDFKLWKDIAVGTDSERKKATDYMCKYNGVDVLKLEKVYNDFAPNMRPKTHAGVVAGKDKWSCPHCGSTHVKLNKTVVTSTGMVQFQMRCQKPSCKGYYKISATAKKQYDEQKSA